MAKSESPKKSRRKKSTPKVEPDAKAAPQAQATHLKYSQPKIKVVVFRMAGNEYVLEAQRVVEIFQPDDLIRLDGLPGYVDGLSRRRGRILPVVDLRKRFGLTIEPPTDETCVIVTKLALGWVGFLVDAAIELLDVSTQDFEVPTQVIAEIDQAYIQGVAHFGDRLLVMLDSRHILNQREQEEVTQLADLSDLDALSQSEVETLFVGDVEGSDMLILADADSQADTQTVRDLITFGLGEEIYALSLSDVESISKPLPISPVPHAPPHVQGLANRHGQVLPVVDLRIRFGLPIKPQDIHTRFIILSDTSGNPSIILWADFVGEIARISLSVFQPPPEQVASVDTKFCQQVAFLDDQLISELYIPAIITDLTDWETNGE